MERSTYLVVNMTFKYHGKIYEPGMVFAGSLQEVDEVKEVGVEMIPTVNHPGGRRLLKPGERIMGLPVRVLENIRTEAIRVAYSQEFSVPFETALNTSREAIIHEVIERQKR